MERQQVTSLVAIDLSAAFDTVDHEILLTVLNRCFGLTSEALQWCESYLRPRALHVKIRNSNSKRHDLPFSVPQGSAAGPILYTVYASTLQHVIVNYDVKISGYADDHAIYSSFEAGTSAAERSAIADQENCLESIKSWMAQNRLKMNDTKTEFVLFGYRAQLDKCNTTQLKVGNADVQKSECMKYLGVWLDQELSLKRHISEKCRLAAINLRNIRALRNHLTVNSCKTLVQALVMSHLDYGNALFIDLPAATIHPAQMIQNFAAKVVLGRRKFDSATDALRELHWLPIGQRSKFKLLTLVYKSLHNQAPKYLQDLLVVHKPNRATRLSANNLNLVVPRTSRSTFASRSFSVAGPRHWNSLPRDIKLSETLVTFRKKLKTYLFTEYFGEN